MPATVVRSTGLERTAFDKFRVLIFDTCGISLSEQKEPLVSARIGKRMRVLGLTDFTQYYNAVVSDTGGAELAELIDAISTNVTHFFREAPHFEYLATVLGTLGGADASELRIWCAACSSGEEPYSIAMAALDALPPGTPLRIVASDISTRVLRQAKQGVYRARDMRTVPPALLKRYFREGVGRAAELYRVKAALRARVEFRQINLSTPPYPVEGGLHIIFCRNVMIYFDQELRRRLVQQFEQMLRPGGYLFVGMAESLSTLQLSLTKVAPSVFRKE